MADLSITASAVKMPAGGRFSSVIVGETVVAGDVLYLNTDTKWWKADALTLLKSGNGSGANIRLALSGGAADQPVAVLEPGQVLTLNAVVTKTIQYVLSATSGGGKIAPIADLVSTNWFTPLGYGISTTQIQWNPVSTGLQK